MTLPCHGCNFWAFQKPVVDLHIEIIDLCNASPSLFAIYIFPYNLNIVIVPRSICVLLLLYTVPLGLAGDIMMGFWLLISIKPVLLYGSTKCKVQTFVHTPDRNSIAQLVPSWMMQWPQAGRQPPLCSPVAWRDSKTTGTAPARCLEVLWGPRGAEPGLHQPPGTPAAGPARADWQLQDLHLKTWLVKQIIFSTW